MKEPWDKKYWNCEHDSMYECGEVGNFNYMDYQIRSIYLIAFIKNLHVARFHALLKSSVQQWAYRILYKMEDFH